jgi:BMFP domain-containing protein YqiC
LSHKILMRLEAINNGITTNINTLRGELENRIDGLKDDMNRQLDSMRSSVRNVKEELDVIDGIVRGNEESVSLQQRIALLEEKARTAEARAAGTALVTQESVRGRWTAFAAFITGALALATSVATTIVQAMHH